MTLTQLEYAVALQKYGSFKEASVHLHISQPALSIQINKLEQSVGLLIFDRSRSPVRPTVEGREFLDKASQLIHDARDLENLGSITGTKNAGKLKIGIIPTLAPFLVPLFADSFQLEFPKIQLDIIEITTEKIIQGIRDGQLDAGILSTPIHASGVDTIELFYEKFFLYSSQHVPEKSRTLSTLDYKKLWLLEEGNCFRDQVNDFCNISKIREHKDFIYRSNSIDALIRIVDSKGGMTILPELTTLVLTDDQVDNTSEIMGKLPKAREVSLIKRKKTNKEGLIDLLADQLKNSVPKSMLKPDNLEIVDPNIHVQ